MCSLSASQVCSTLLAFLSSLSHYINSLIQRLLIKVVPIGIKSEPHNEFDILGSQKAFRILGAVKDLQQTENLKLYD